ncbi:MAG: TonB-dependent receptor, partial [Planctomycetes bacterium]|nr:TonB-dependent receptor [Planctomycetota bacterium]
PRESGDARGSLPSYALVNLSFIGKNFLDNFEVRGSVLNLLDKDYNDPSDIGTVSSDFPQQGRSFMIELRYKY